MLAGLGAFAGGLSDSIYRNKDLNQRQQYIDAQNKQLDMQGKRESRDQETHDAKMDEFKRLRSANEEVAGLLTGAQPQIQPAQPPETPQAPGLPSPQMTSTSQAPGLANAPAPQAPQMPAGQVIAKNLLTGNILTDPDKLTAIANIYGKHGLTEKMVPWLTQAYQAKKSGIVDALPYLMAGDGKNAAAMLKKGGMDIQGEPTLVDKDNGVWSFNIGGNTRELSMRQIIGMADPENWAKNQNEQTKTQADINLKNAQTEYYKGAKTELTKAQAAKQGRLGDGSKGGGSAKGPRVVKTMETNQGYVAVMSDGSQKPLKGEDGKPLYGTTGAKIAGQLVGKTLDPFGDNSDIAGNVNKIAGQLQGGAAPASKRIPDLPEGSKQIGTSKGKPVYQSADGKTRWIGE